MPRTKLQELAHTRNWNRLQIKGACHNLRHVVSKINEMSPNLYNKTRQELLVQLEKELLKTNDVAWKAATGRSKALNKEFTEF